MKTTLRIVRSTSFPDVFRSYRIVLDGQTVGELRGNQERVVPIPTGRHSLSVRIDWCGSATATFAAKEGEEIGFECASAITDWRMLFGFFYIVFLPNDYLRLRRKESRLAAQPFGEPAVAETGSPPLLSAQPADLGG